MQAKRCHQKNVDHKLIKAAYTYYGVLGINEPFNDSISGEMQ